MEHRSEVVKVVKLDYTFDRQLMLEREDSREEGRAEGREEGRAEGRAEGSDEMTELAIHLIRAGRAEDIERCRDATYRNKLLEEFHLRNK